MMARGAGTTGLWQTFCCCCYFLFCRGLCHDVPPKDTQPRCYRDDDASELLCCWETSPLTNCTEAFRLHYEIGSSRSGNVQECPLQNERGPGAASWCTCAVPATVFTNVQYHLVLERITARNKTIVWQHVGELAFKPRPLVNLTVAKRSRSFLLTWKIDYKDKDIQYRTKRNYEVAYWPQGQQGKMDNCPRRDQVCCSKWCRIPDREPPCPAEIKPLAEISSSYEIYADQLVPGLEYMASVRYWLVHWDLWSEWSRPCSWHNDLDLGEQRWQDIPWVCMPVVAAVLTCYLCLGRVKKWQDSIPHPVVMAGEQVFQKEERKSCLHAVKVFLCHLCNRSGQRSQGKSSAIPGQITSEKVLRSGTLAWQEQVLCPETPLIEPTPIVCSCETGAELQTRLEERQECLHIPHANVVASLFSNAVSDGLSSGASTGLEVCPEDPEEPLGNCPPQLPPENTPCAPCLLPKAGLDVPSAQDRRATKEDSPGPGDQSSSVEAPMASAQVARPEPKQGPSGGPLASEEGSQSWLVPHKPPRAHGGAVLDLVWTGGLGLDWRQAGGISPTSAGYKSFSSLSQAATPAEAWEEEPLLLGRDQIQLPDSSGGSGSHHHPHIRWSSRHCGLQLSFQACQDLPWVSPGQVAPAAPPQEDSCQVAPRPPGGTSHPADLPSSGYRSLASLLLRNGTEGMYRSSLGLESPYKPLLSILRSRPTEPSPPGRDILLLGPGLSGKTTGIPACPAVLWEASLELSKQAELGEDDLAEDSRLAYS